MYHVSVSVLLLCCFHCGTLGAMYCLICEKQLENAVNLLASHAQIAQYQ